MKPCVKVMKANKIAHVQQFLCPVIRTQWLRREGFYESSGVWKHLDGRIAGMFRSDDPQTIIDNCHKALKKRGDMNLIHE